MHDRHFSFDHAYFGWLFSTGNHETLCSHCAIYGLVCSSAWLRDPTSSPWTVFWALPSNVEFLTLSRTCSIHTSFGWDCWLSSFVDAFNRAQVSARLTTCQSQAYCTPLFMLGASCQATSVADSSSSGPADHEPSVPVLMGRACCNKAGAKLPSGHTMTSQRQGRLHTFAGSLRRVSSMPRFTAPSTLLSVAAQWAVLSGGKHASPRRQVCLQNLSKEAQ